MSDFLPSFTMADSKSPSIFSLKWIGKQYMNVKTQFLSWGGFIWSNSRFFGWIFVTTTMMTFLPLYLEVNWACFIYLLFLNLHFTPYDLFSCLFNVLFLIFPIITLVHSFYLILNLLFPHKYRQ